MALQLRTGPSIEPVSLTDMKNFLRVDGSDDDILIASLITAARIYIETTTQKIMITQSWSYFKDRWPKSGIIHLPLAPLQTVGDIRLHNEGGSYETLTPSDYEVDLLSNAPRIRLKHVSSPASLPRTLNHVEVQFEAGYGNAESDAPNDLRHALMMLAGHWYEQREPIGPGGPFHEVPATISAIISNYKSLKVQ